MISSISKFPQSESNDFKIKLLELRAKTVRCIKRLGEISSEFKSVAEDIDKKPWVLTKS